MSAIRWDRQGRYQYLLQRLYQELLLVGWLKFEMFLLAPKLRQFHTFVAEYFLFLQNLAPILLMRL